MPSAINNVILRARFCDFRRDFRRIFFRRTIPRQMHILIKNRGQTFVIDTERLNCPTVIAHSTNDFVKTITVRYSNACARITFTVFKFFTPIKIVKVSVAESKIIAHIEIAYFVNPRTCAFYLKHKELSAFDVFQNPLRQTLFGRLRPDGSEKRLSLTFGVSLEHSEFIQTIPSRLTFRMMSLHETRKKHALAVFQGFTEKFFQNECQNDIIAGNVRYYVMYSYGISVGKTFKYGFNTHLIGLSYQRKFTL